MKAASLAVASALLMASAASAQDSCGLCDTVIVTNSDLAACFLAKYQELERAGNGAIVVDLSECPESRGVVEALPPPGVTVEEPNLQFMVSLAQLACLKKKLEEPGLVLDPSARIDLESCQ
jgi:hypothetical protein